MGDERSHSTLERRLREATDANRKLEARLEEFEKAKEALLVREMRWRMLAEHIDEAFWLVSPDEGELHYVSPAYEWIMGRPCASLYEDPSSWTASLHDEDRRLVLNAIRQRGPGSHRDARNIEYRVIHPDGALRWVWMRSHPVVDETGTFVARVSVAVDITDRKISEEKLRAAALHDRLTHLPNRSLLSERLTRAIERSNKDPAYKFAVLFLDIDRFKIINDSLGHEVGDLLLVSIAERLESNLRAGDTTSLPSEGHVPARLGGDEFVILLDGIRRHEDATLVAERLQEALSEPHQIGDHSVISTASIGIVTSAGNYRRAEDVLRDADTAMYHAKSRGKARHVVFDKRMHKEAVRRLELEQHLRRAVDNDEFSLNYQPIIALSTGDLIGFEALIRWHNPERGPIPPDQFIGLAEELGLIVPIGKWALAEAARQISLWHAMFPHVRPMTMNVNLSKRQVSQPDLSDVVDDILRTTGIEPTTLKLEVTESVIMDSPEHITPLLHRLKELGVLLCMDDFGTGHSSLSCLHRFPIDVLKIDRTFVLNTDGNREYAAVIHAIITLAHTLSMTVVGEGVETGGQLAQLQALDCDWAQGNFFAPALTVGAAEAFITGRHGLAQSA